MIGQSAAGEEGSAYQAAIGNYLSALSQYVGGSNNLKMDGVKIPHLFPGTKLNLRNLGTPGGVGDKREPAVYMNAGDVIEVEITGLGTLRNTVVNEA